MKAVIMCGGAGTRLRPITESRPKPLCRILNVPVLENILLQLISQGICDIWLSLGCKAQDIVQFCENRHFDANLHFCEEERPLGTAGGVKNCLPVCDENVLVLSGDNLTDLDFNQVESFHNEEEAIITVVGKEVPDPREYGAILCDEAANVVGFSEKPTWEQAVSFTVNTGIYILSPSVLESIPPDTSFDFAEDLFPAALKDGRKFVCYKTEAFWGDMGEFDAFHEITETLLSKGGKPFLIRGRLISEEMTDDAGNIFIPPCLIGAGFSSGRNNQIGPGVVFGDNCTLGSGCVIRRTVTGDGLSVGDGCDLSSVLADDEVRIGARSVLEKNVVVGYGADVGRFSRILADVKIWPGRKIDPESVVGRDMLYESPASLEVDTFGISGKMFSQITVSDAARLGQAIASVRDTVRIGVGCDMKNGSEIFKSLCCAGIRSCGVICYDFEEMYRSQAYFYAAYCSLDAFIYVSASGDVIQFSFLGKYGQPVSAGTARSVNRNFRFSSFRFARPDETRETFRMHLLSTAYTAALNRLLPGGLCGFSVTVECENQTLKDLVSDFLKKAGGTDVPGGLQFLFNETGTEFYCVENDRFYSSDRIKGLLCEMEFAEGNNVIVGEDVSDEVRRSAIAYGRKLLTFYENGAPQEADSVQFIGNLWNFDAVFLCVRLLSVLTTVGTTLASLMEGRPDFALRKRIVDTDLPAAELRARLEASGARKREPGDVYYTYKGGKGSVRVRQLGNSNRLRILSEAADMETAADLSAELCSKIKAIRLDNIIKK